MKLEKAYKNLDEETIKELESMSPEELKQKVVQASQAMKQVQDELDDNSEYQEVLENKKAMEQGRNEINKRQKSIVTICLHQLHGELVS